NGANKAPKLLTFRLHFRRGESVHAVTETETDDAERVLNYPAECEYEPRLLRHDPAARRTALRLDARHRCSCDRDERLGRGGPRLSGEPVRAPVRQRGRGGYLQRARPRRGDRWRCRALDGVAHHALD